MKKKKYSNIITINEKKKWNDFVNKKKKKIIFKKYKI